MDKENSLKPSYKQIRGILLPVIIFVVLMVGLRFAVTSSISLGADFYIYWQSGRAIVVRQVSPYDSSTTEIIQQGIYGRLAKPNEDQVAYAYPPSGLLPVFPSSVMPYPWAEAYWMALNIVLLYCAVIAMLRKPPIWLLATLIFFYPISRNMILGSFSCILFTGLLVSYSQIGKREHLSTSTQWLIGGVLAWCAMKPQFSLVPILLMLVISLRKKYWGVFYGLIGGGALLALFSWILVPTWISDWMQVINKYAGYVTVKPLIQSWLNIIGLQWSTFWVKGILGLIVGGISIFLFYYWWKGRFPGFILFGWAILINQLINPNANSLLSDQIIFLLPILIWGKENPQPGYTFFVSWIFFLIVPWALFGLYFSGKEPYQAASGLALLFLVWWLAGSITILIRNHKNQKGAIAIEE